MGLRKSESEKMRDFVIAEFNKALKCRKSNPQYMYKRISELGNPDYLHTWPRYLQEYARGYSEAFYTIMMLLREDSEDVKNRYLEKLLID